MMILLCAQLQANALYVLYMDCVNGLALETGIISRITKASLIRNSGSPSSSTGFSGISGHYM